MVTTIYLAGPVAGETLAAAGNWRRTVAAYLDECGFRVLDPLRAKYDVIGQDGGPLKDSYSGILGSGSKAIFERDLYDVRQADIVLANFTEAKKVSIGTVYEVAVAHELRKYVAVCMRTNDPFHDHPFIHESASIIVPDLWDTVFQLVKEFSA